MIVGNPEGFKSWMTTVLEPLCDADPAALAKYVYALVKKDRPVEELRQSMLAQLEVFLQKDTEPFLTLLFSKLETEFSSEASPSPSPTQVIRIKEEPVDKGLQLNTHSSTSTDSLLQEAALLPHAPDNSDGPDLSSLDEVEDYVDKTTVDNEVLAEVNEFSNSDEPAPAHKPTQPPPESVVQEIVSGSVAGSCITKSVPALGNGAASAVSSRCYERKSDSEKEDKAGAVKRRVSPGSPQVAGRRFERSRSRSRSWEQRSVSRRSRSRSRRSRSRGRDRDRSRAWRNKSPPFRPRFDRDRTMRSSWSKSPVLRSRSRSRSRSPLKQRSRYRHRSPLPRSRSRSHSLVLDSPPQDADDLRHTLNQTSATKEIATKKRRCRDYDEKGFCMRGEMCPYDHGADPMVVEDVCQVLQTIQPQPHPPPRLPTHTPTPNLNEYNPDAPSMEPRIWSKPFRASGRAVGRLDPVMRGLPVFPPHSQHQRELISIPVVEIVGGQYYQPHAIKRQCPPHFGNDMEPVMKQRFDYNRLGSGGGIGGGRSLRVNGNCSLHLKKIPSGLNNIAHLHNHFVKFGKIVNIQVSFEGDPEAALITFTAHAEASAAYKSTEAVLNNRFIKVFWYNPDKDNKQENVVPQLTRTSAKERLGAPVVNVSTTPQEVQQPKECEKVLMSGPNLTKTVYIPPNFDAKSAAIKSESKKMIVTANFAPNPLEIQAAAARELMKKKVEKRKEALSLTKTYLKKKSDIIEEALSHQRVLIERLENPNTPAEKKPEIVEALKSLQEETNALKDSIPTIMNPTNNAVKANPQLAKRTREEMQKQILDAELDLFNQQQEGKDTTELKKRMLELRTKAQNLGLLNNNGQQGVLRLNNRGASRYYPHPHPTRGKSNFNPHFNATVDHRPTKLLVSGFESDDKVDVLQHFSKFGEVVGHVWDEATPALVIQFKTRKEAETAMSKGRNFQDRLMSVTWFTQAQNMGIRNSGMRSVILLNENVGDLITEHEDEDEALRINIEANEDLLLQDEEDEEDEDRSWRR